MYSVMKKPKSFCSTLLEHLAKEKPHPFVSLCFEDLKQTAKDLKDLKDLKFIKTPIVINTAGLSEDAINGFTSKQREFKTHHFAERTEQGNKYYTFNPLSETKTTITYECTADNLTPKQLKQRKLANSIIKTAENIVKSCTA